ncbi:DNA polymerase I, partial [Candidatus Daviesbacteria bacterium]|nr:DNA polymerase I [Candidatus Daviesbacteria bacterium]
EGSLHELSSAHVVIPWLLEYRQLFKLVSTYVDALPKSVGEDDRIHSTFNVEGSATGRISSQSPNLQNIPVKGEMGGEIRKAFVADKDKILLAADYSQIELRIMAHLADDPGLKRAFNEGLDIHAATAAKIFKVPLDKVTKQQRMVGKTMNFATLYGQGAHALSRQLGVEYEVARVYIQEYFDEFPSVREWMQKTLEFGYENGYVETLWGRRRYIPELKADNRMIKAAGERAAINHPVQGTAADMIKKAMVEIDRELSVVSHQSSDSLKADSERSERSDSCGLILQVHDELLFECTPKSVKEVAKMVKDKMENALKLDVPVVVDLKIGKNWGEMRALEV